MSRVARIVTVEGVSACMKDHAAKYGVRYASVMRRMNDGWTREQALGIVAAPVRQRGKLDATRWSNLGDGLRLGTPLDNMWKAMSGELTAEEYLRREGVPSNGYVLSSRDH